MGTSECGEICLDSDVHGPLWPLCRGKRERAQTLRGELGSWVFGWRG